MKAGYGTVVSMFAVEHGEVDGMCGVSWSTLKVSNPDCVQNKRLNVMLQAGAKPQAGLPDVPLAVDQAATREDRALIELLFFPQEMGRPFVMPPDTPKPLVATIRRAFDATMRDPALHSRARLCEAEGAGATRRRVQWKRRAIAAGEQETAPCASHSTSYG